MSIFFERAALRELVYGLSERFVPTRLILLNYWLYQRQVFYFASGKLFLTGDNGSGKSTALTAAITSIFDGDTSPSRMDPFGGGKRSVRYYLLGDREAGFEYDSRRAYVALEFQNPDGGFVTVGLGLQASAGSRDLQKWGFAVSERLEHDSGISLVSSQNTPLSRRELRDAFAQTDGRVVESVEEYAKLVRRTLYPKSNDEEYSKLLELLLTIRGAKLGREVRPSEIERLLRLSLSRLDPQILEQLREGIEGMDRHQRRLEVLDAQVGASSRIASAFFDAALSRLTAADAAQTQAETNLHNLRLEQTALLQKLETLRLEIATQTAALETTTSEQAALDLERDSLEAQLQNADGALRDAETKLEETRVAVRTEQDRLRRARERLERIQTRIQERLEEQQTLQKLGTVLEQALGRVVWYKTLESLSQRRTALEAAQTAWRRYEADTERLSEREYAVRQAKTAVEAARDQLESDTLDLEQVMQQTAATLVQQASALFEVPREYAQTLTTQLDPSEAVAWLFQEAYSHENALQHRRDHTQNVLHTRLEEQHALATQISALEQASQAVPPLPKQRAQAMQALEQAGIKYQILYQCLRPKAKTDVAGLESGLLHSGVLTALVVAQKDLPKATKTLRSSQLEDALLQVSSSSEGLQLEKYLQTEPDAPEMVQAWLAQPQTFALDGTWQQGALHGVSTPSGVRFLGAAAREAERQRQLVVLRQDFADAEVAFGLAQEEYLEAAQALQDFIRAWNALQNPKTERQSRQQADTARQTSAARFEDRTRAELQALEALSAAQAAAASATNALEQVLQPLGLPTQQNALTAALGELVQVEASDRDLAQNSREQQQLLEALRELETDVEARNSDIAELEKSRLDLENKRDQLTTRVQEMRAQLENPDIKQWRERLGRVRNRLSELRGLLRELERSQTKHQSELELSQTRLPALLAQLENANQLLERRREQRQAALSRHPRIEAQLVPSGASLEVLEQRARDLEYGLKDVFDSQKHHLEYPESFTPVLENHLPRFLLEGQPATPDHLTSHLATELEEAQRLLSEEEARIFHNELVFALSEKLYTQILEARAFVKNIRQTLSGLRFHDEQLDLELHRTSDSPIAELVDGKMKPENQTDAQREQFANTVRDLVARLRSQPNPDKSFPQALEEALDYRQWYGFTFYSIVGERRVEITDRKFQSRSGGERSAVLYTFMFAALGARFGAMGSNAPRLIGLDEAFAGMDPHNIAALYQIMAALDLSLIATSPSDIYLSRSLEVASAYRLFRVSSGDADGVSSLARLWNGSRAIDMGM